MASVDHSSKLIEEGYTKIGGIKSKSKAYEHVDVFENSEIGKASRRWICKFCNQMHSGSLVEIETHLGGVLGFNIGACPAVVEDVKMGMETLARHTLDTRDEKTKRKGFSDSREGKKRKKEKPQQGLGGQLVQIPLPLTGVDHSVEEFNRIIDPDDQHQLQYPENAGAVATKELDNRAENKQMEYVLEAASDGQSLQIPLPKIGDDAVQEFDRMLVPGQAFQGQVPLPVDGDEWSVEELTRALEDPPPNPSGETGNGSKHQCPPPHMVNTAMTGTGMESPRSILRKADGLGNAGTGQWVSYFRETVDRFIGSVRKSWVRESSVRAQKTQLGGIKELATTRTEKIDEWLSKAQPIGKEAMDLLGKIGLSPQEAGDPSASDISRLWKDIFSKRSGTEIIQLEVEMIQLSEKIRELERGSDDLISQTPLEASLGDSMTCRRDGSSTDPLRESLPTPLV